MVLSTKDPEVYKLARELAARTGETITQAIVKALRNRLALEGRKSGEVESKVADAMEIGRHYVSQPLLDERSPEEILGYDDRGLPP